MRCRLLSRQCCFLNLRLLKQVWMEALETELLSFAPNPRHDISALKHPTAKQSRIHQRYRLFTVQKEYC